MACSYPYVPRLPAVDVLVVSTKKPENLKIPVAIVWPDALLSRVLGIDAIMICQHQQPASQYVAYRDDLLVEENHDTQAKSLSAVGR